MSRNFDKVDDLINIGSPASLNNLSAISIVAWIKPVTSGEGSIGQILQKRGNSASFSGFRFNHFFTINLDFIVDHSVDDLVRRSTDTMSANEWHAVAVAWDGSTTAENCRLYIDLAEVSAYSATVNGSGTRSDDSGNDLIIGRDANGSNTYDGNIAYVQIFNRVLNLSEINNCLRFPGSISNGLVGFWPLWGTSSPEPDYSGNGNNGTVTGAVLGSGPPVGRPAPHNRSRYVWGYRLPAAVGGESFLQNITESWTWNETLSKNVIKNLSENYTFAEAVSKQVLKNLTENYTWNEILSKIISKNLTESMTWNDTISKEIIKNIIESYTFTEVFSSGNTFLQNIIESWTFSESQSKQVDKFLSESFTVVETISKIIIKNLIEQIIFSESVSKSIFKNLTEHYTFSEAITKDFLKNLSENFTWQDTLAKDILKNLTEHYTFSESESNQLSGLIRTLTFLTIKSMIQRHDINAMENDLIGTGFNKQDKDFMERDSDSLQPDS